MKGTRRGKAGRVTVVRVPVVRITLRIEEDDMSRVTRIEIHFTVNEENRVATITPSPPAGRALKQILLDTNGPFNKPRPPEITMDGGTALGPEEGPQVCYMLGNERVCW